MLYIMIMMCNTIIVLQKLRLSCNHICVYKCTIISKIINHLIPLIKMTIKSFVQNSDNIELLQDQRVIQYT